MHYHAHIYWSTPEDRSQAESIRNILFEISAVGRMHDVPIGPHPRAMFQAIYSSENKEHVEGILNTMRGNLSILLHEAINDDLRDHTEGARWLGTPLELKLDFFKE